ncbi:LRR receptor-like serine/threonine-protein kinase GSO1 [Prosopis cineraria]|uniref:LRR receptor-like serine/threonine-protein kinase GSO1 n=1 Tax=Prosopis cineraria TaxID=364024 RepID=UPI00240F2D9A|nr:LRR receptor-like serine/threonine-protein kinase GSO1 [Prosopis cineraria]
MSLLVPLSLFFFAIVPASSSSELDTLMTIKHSLDPQNIFLTSWTPNSDPCSGGFEGVACNEQGHVANISLQGKGLYGSLPAAIGDLKSLTGLYLHFNALSGTIPKEIANLSDLTDLYLNVNNLYGDIPHEIGHMSNLQVLQLCCNKFTGSIPTELGNLERLSVVALQNNELSGAIPASLGQLQSLTRLDLSFNNLFGPIPVRLADAPKLESLDIQNNSLSGNVPPALGRLKGGFQYINNPGLCGTEFTNLLACKSLFDPSKPEPFEPDNFSTPKGLPASVDPKDERKCSDDETHCQKSLQYSKMALVFGVIGIIVASTVSGLSMFVWYHRHQKQKIGCSIIDASSPSSSLQVCRKNNNAASLISLEYSNGWDPLAKGKSTYSQEILESFTFNLEEVERATQCFSEVNLLGKSSNNNYLCGIYKGILRDRSHVVVKCINKTSCKSDETEFLKGLKIMTSIKHENLVRFRGFCCSKGRGECFLVYDFAPNGNLSQYLDLKKGDSRVLEWSTRASIIHGIARGIGYLHGKNKGRKQPLVHQNISADNVLLDAHYNSLLADSGLHKLLADDVIFSTLKASAAKGYLAPEYATTGCLTEKSDIYAFGVIVFQLLTGKSDITQLYNHHQAETSSSSSSCGFNDMVDDNLEGRFSESEAAKLGRIALVCTHESPHERPSIGHVMQELSEK